MCGRFALYPTPGEIERMFMLSDVGDIPPSYNITPTQQCPVVLVENGRRLLSWRRWSKGIDNRYSMINARDDTFAPKRRNGDV